MIGTNLSAPIDYNPNCIYADLIKASRKFGSPDQPWDEKAKVDENGWPVGDAGTCLLTNIPIIAGTYKFSCTGKCSIASVASYFQVSNLKYDATTNTTTADMIVDNKQTQLYIKFIGTNGGIKDIKILRPNHSPTNVFNKDFLNAIKPFSILRLMDYLLTNNSTVTDWKTRCKPTDAQWSIKGGPIEPMIDLCNQTKKDLWINIPHLATPDYVTNLATLLRDKLDPSLKAYVEYSNEVWNWMFSQSHDNLEKAQEEEHSGLIDYDYDKCNNIYYWAWRRIGKRCVDISKIFQNVYGASSLNKRFRVMLGLQLGWGTNDTQYLDVLEFVRQKIGEPSKFFFGVAGAPYIGMSEALQKSATATQDDIINALSQSVDDWVASALLRVRTAAAKYGIRYINYEGGIDLGQEDVNVATKTAVQTNSKLYAVIKKYLEAVTANSDGLVYYDLCGNWTKWGYWGLYSDLTKVTPKAQSVIDFVNVNPNKPVDIDPNYKPPAPIPQSTPDVPMPSNSDIIIWPNDIGSNAKVAGGSWDKTGKGTLWLGQNGIIPFTLNVTTDSVYDVIVTVNTPRSPAPQGKVIGLVQAGKTVNSVNVKNSVDTEINVGRVSCKAGLNQLTLLAIDWGWNLKKIRLSLVANVTPVPTPLPVPTPSSKKITKITIFYEDGTFDSILVP